MTPKIIDATLREGCQAPGVNFDAAESLAIAKMLAALGINAIECGHPLKSPEEMERVRTLTCANLPIPILAHSRAKKEDIDAVAESGAQWIGIFVGINHTTRTARLRDASVADILALIQTSVRYAKSLNLKVRYTVEDASRTSAYDLEHAYGAAVDAGADRICFADTVGIFEPQEISAMVRRIKRLAPATDLEIHIHDDRALSMAGSLAAIDAGAEYISSSVNGLGERCGITDTLVLLANLHHRRMRDLSASPLSLRDVSRIVAEYARSGVDERRPVTGKFAFTHKARLHRLAMERDENSYTWIAANLVGAQTVLVED